MAGQNSIDNASRWFFCCPSNENQTVTQSGASRPEGFEAKSKSFITLFFEQLWEKKGALALGALLITTGALIDLTVGVFTLGTLSVPTAALTWVNYTTGIGLMWQGLDSSWDHARLKYNSRP